MTNATIGTNREWRRADAQMNNSTEARRPRAKMREVMALGLWVVGRLCLIVPGLAFALLPASAQVSVLTRAHDNQRTSANTAETIPNLRQRAKRVPLTLDTF